MSKSSIGRLAAAAVIGLATSGMGIGAIDALTVKAGHSAPRSTGPKRQPRKAAQIRQQAAEAKRERRHTRNLAWAARGAYGQR